VRVFKTKRFARDARKFGVSDAALLEVLNRGSIDADLGGGVVKQRIAREGQGKSGGFRSIILLKPGVSAFFVFVFAKSAHDNITKAELVAFRQLALELFELDQTTLNKAVAAGSLIEIRGDAR
jgi:hypothetical protein